MKYSKRCKAAIGGVVWGIVFFLIVPAGAMISQKSTFRRVRVPQPVQNVQPERYKSEMVWVKTSDDVIMGLPLWQIDQLKVLQVLFVHQKGGNSKDNPVDASMLTSNQLGLLQHALEAASDFQKFEFFCRNLTQNERVSLMDGASILEAQGLLSLVMTLVFPKEVQGLMGATVLQQEGIIAPVVMYLQSSETIPLSHKGPVLSIALSPDGNRIISGAAGIDHNLILYDLKAGKEIKNLVLETFPGPCVAFSLDGNYIATGSSREFDNLIVWDGATGEPIKTFNGMSVNCVAFSPNSKYLIAGSADASFIGYTPILYDIKSRKIISTFKDFNGSINCVVFRPHSNDIVLGLDVTQSQSPNVVVYDGKTCKRKTKNFVGLSKGVPCMACSSDGNYFVGGTLELILWNAETGEKIKVFKDPYPLEYKTCVAFDPSGRYIAAGYQRSQNNLFLFSCATGELIGGFSVFGQVRCVAFSPDGNYLFCGCDQGLVAFKMISQKVLNYIATQLNIAQARFLYRLYLAKINNVPVILDTQDLDYQLFITLPEDVQRAVKAFLPFELVLDIAEKAVQEKMNEYKKSLFYSSSYFFGRNEKTHDEKKKAIKNAMLNLDKNSVSYKACERLLGELEQEEAFILK